MGHHKYQRKPKPLEYVVRFEDLDDKALAMVELVLKTAGVDYTVSVEPGWPNLRSA